MRIDDTLTIRSDAALVLVPVSRALAKLVARLPEGYSPASGSATDTGGGLQAMLAGF